MKRILLLLTLQLIGICVSAQEIKLQGQIVNQNNVGIEGAHIMLSDLSDGQAADQVISQKEGKYSLSLLKNKEYRLTVQHLSYEIHSQILSTKGKGASRLPIIKMIPSVIELQNIDLVELTPVIVKEDTVQYSAAAFKTRPDAEVKDLIEKLPGVDIEDDGSVTAEGETVQEVLVDGKEFFGSDPQIALNNIPVDMVESVQVIDRKSDQARFTGFDDGERSKAINIVTKKERRYGYFGKIAGGGGTDNRYATSGNINLFNQEQRISLIGMSNNVNQQGFSTEDLLGTMSAPSRGGGRGRGSSGSSNFMTGSSGGINTTHSIGLNYVDSWGERWEVTGSYFFNQANNNTSQVSSTEYFLNQGENQITDEQAFGDRQNGNHRINMRLEYGKGRSTSFIWRPKVSFQNTNVFNSSNTMTALADGTPLNTSNVLNNSDNFGVNFSNSFLLRQKFSKEGRTMSLNWSLGYSDKDYLGASLSGLEYFSLEREAQDSIARQNDNVSLRYSTSGNLVYTEPLWEGSQLQLGYYQSWQRQEADNQAYDILNTEQPEFLPEFSNTFVTEQSTFRPSLGLRYRLGGFNASANVRYQYTDIKNKRIYPDEGGVREDYHNLLPDLNLQYRFDRGKHLRFSYRNNTSLPSVGQLQDVVDNSDPLNISAGNPFLSPENSHNLQLNYRQFDFDSKRMFFINLRAVMTDQKIANHSFIAAKDTVFNGIDVRRGARVVQPVNLDGYQNFSLRTTYATPIAPLGLNISFNTTGRHVRNVGMANNVQSFTYDSSLGEGIKLSSTFSERYDFSLSGRSTYHWVSNEVQQEYNGNYWDHKLDARATIEPIAGWILSSNFVGRLYNGDDDLITHNIFYWNAYMAKKLFKNQSGELRLSVNDILNQNKSINRSVTESYVQTSQTQVLPRYFMLSFTYRLKAFKSPGRERQMERMQRFDKMRRNMDH